MTTNPYDANGRRVLKRGCRVRDTPYPGPCGLFLDEHILRDGRWIHPTGTGRNGRWTYDEDERDDG